MFGIKSKRISQLFEKRAQQWEQTTAALFKELEREVLPGIRVFLNTIRGQGMDITNKIEFGAVTPLKTDTHPHGLLLIESYTRFNEGDAYRSVITGEDIVLSSGEAAYLSLPVVVCLPFELAETGTAMQITNHLLNLYNESNVAETDQELTLTAADSGAFVEKQLYNTLVEATQPKQSGDVPPLEISLDGFDENQKLLIQLQHARTGAIKH